MLYDKKIAEDVARILLDIKAIKLNSENPFTWTSGIKSPIYCDNRVTLAHPEAREKIISYLLDATENFEDFDAVHGVATAGIPYGMLIAYAINIPFGYIREKPKGHGRQNQIEGAQESGSTTLIVEDLISTGKSSIIAFEAAREAKIKVAGVLSIFDYDFNETFEAFTKINCPYISLCNYDTLLKTALDTKYIKQEQLEDLKSWRISPSTWRV